MNDTMAPADLSPDRDERIEEFLTRHGGAAGSARRAGKSASGLDGWNEVIAADGFRLRCDWSRSGGREEMTYRELPPG